jgi:hypothetical protein
MSTYKENALRIATAVMAAAAIATGVFGFSANAHSMTKTKANILCNREAAIMTLAVTPNYYYVRSQAELAGAEIGTALGQMIVFSVTKAECMRKYGFAPKRSKSSVPVGTSARQK